MALPAPYFGCNIDDVLQSTDNFFAEYNRTMPAEDLGGFNPRVRGYGSLWAEVQSRPSLPGHYVIAGLSGNMSGVPVAHFMDYDVARTFAKHFGECRVFALRNADRWRAFVKAAHAAKAIDAGHLERLMSLGRCSGILDGRELGADDIQDLYETNSPLVAWGE